MSEDKLDLNTIENEGEYKGATKAWKLAWNSSNLQYSFLKNCSSPIDMNATPSCNDELNGITLAWIIANDESFDLLHLLSKNVVSPINLNARAIDPDYDSAGVTVAWLLAHYNKFALLDYLFETFSGLIDLNAQPLNDIEPYEWEDGKPVTLVEKLINNQQFILFFKLIKRYLSSNSENDVNIATDILVKYEKEIAIDVQTLRSFLFDMPQAYLVSVFNKLENGRLRSCVGFFLIKDLIQKVREPLITGKANFSSDDTELRDDVENIFNLVKAIPPALDSDFYKESRDLLGNFLLNYISDYSYNEGLQLFALDKLSAIFSEVEINPFNEKLEVVSAIKLYAINFFIDAGEKRLVFGLIAECVSNKKIVSNNDANSNSSIPSFWGKRLLDDKDDQDHPPKKLKKESDNNSPPH